MQSNLFLFRLSLVASCATTTTQALALGPNNHHPFFVNSRTEVLNLLHHPLQLQIATGELPLGSFRRLILDRGAIVEGLQSACSSVSSSSSSSVVVGSIGSLIDKEIEHHPNDSKRWNAAAESAGKTIAAPPGIKCYNCGGNHLNIDCPEDLQISTSALALKSMLEMNGIAGASAVLRSYSFACKRLLEASESVTNCNADEDNANDAYVGWLETHAVRWESLATACEEQMIIDIDDDNNNSGAASSSSSSSYDICLSMFYNWIDTEASTAGIRSQSQNNRNDAASLADAIERIEPGYLATRDKNRSFIADITGTKDARAKSDAAARKVNAAAAYLAAKKRKKK